MTTASMDQAIQVQRLSTALPRPSSSSAATAPPLVSLLHPPHPDSVTKRVTGLKHGLSTKLLQSLVLVAAYGGLRWGELVGLRVKRVDLLHGRVTVAEQVAEVNGQLIPGPPKTEAGRRTSTLPAVAAAALAEHLAEFAEPGPEGLVFRAPQGGYLRRSNFRRRWWVPAMKAAGVEGLRFHDLRHPAATLALAAGANTRELMERMGHTSPQVALRYQHVVAGRDQAIAAALDALVQAAATLPPEGQVEGASGTKPAREVLASAQVGGGGPLTWAVGGRDGRI
jgi:integrase